MLKYRNILHATFSLIQKTKVSGCYKVVFIHKSGMSCYKKLCFLTHQESLFLAFTLQLFSVQTRLYSLAIKGYMIGEMQCILIEEIYLTVLNLADLGDAAKIKCKITVKIIKYLDTFQIIHKIS